MTDKEATKIIDAFFKRYPEQFDKSDKENIDFILRLPDTNEREQLCQATTALTRNFLARRSARRN